MKLPLNDDVGFVYNYQLKSLLVEIRHQNSPIFIKNSFRTAKKKSLSKRCSPGINGVTANPSFCNFSDCSLMVDSSGANTRTTLVL